MEAATARLADPVPVTPPRCSAARAGQGQGVTGDTTAGGSPGYPAVTKVPA
jgi:hypothetical protein